MDGETLCRAQREGSGTVPQIETCPYPRREVVTVGRARFLVFACLCFDVGVCTSWAALLTVFREKRRQLRFCGRGQETGLL